MSLFAIVTGGAGVPAQDIISTWKTHVPIVFVFLGLVVEFVLPFILDAGLVPP